MNASSGSGTGAGALASRGAAAVLAAFEEYQDRFRTITCRAKLRFEQQDWHGAQSDAVERLELYKRVIDRIILQVRELLGSLSQDAGLWQSLKQVYASDIANRNDLELAETFFNSVTRRVFTTVGVDPRLEFLDSDLQAQPTHLDQPVYNTYLPHGPSTLAALPGLIGAILSNVSFAVRYADLAGDSQLAAEEISNSLQACWDMRAFERIEVIRHVFYRGNAAYLLGRICSGTRLLPLALCLLHGPDGLRLDAVLTDEDDVSILFSFTRSYFHVEVDRPHELVAFLKSIIPLKRVAELYIAIGYNKHGKTELYRDLHRHMENSTDRFEIARGERGMVMVVFSLPSYDMVFKVIRDRVDPPKSASRRDVMERYDLVFKHDRAGRLVDAQEFEHLSFERGRFTDDLLAELLRLAPSMIQVSEECVIIKHLYTERRMTPLNLYVKEAGEEAARSAVIDYGQTIKDLAYTNIFPGDVLLKNFGVTRHGRVVFYDYDELCLVTDCKFRKIPQARSFDDEMEADPWFYVGPLDIFPEEFRTFLGLQEPLKSIFESQHADLYEAGFWKGIQKRHHAGEIIPISPYPESRRLRAA